MLVCLDFQPLVSMRRFISLTTVLRGVVFSLFWLIEILEFCFAALLDSTYHLSKRPSIGLE